MFAHSHSPYSPLDTTIPDCDTEQKQNKTHHKCNINYDSLIISKKKKKKSSGIWPSAYDYSIKHTRKNTKIIIMK